ncbi:TPA: hypothetical protein RG647_RS06415 [Providencia rettgeri]|uniref:hypothetical protein n=1 Tax=Providencia sp. PROV129 TaxID=2949839 RepID=UPI00234A6FD4|nr:hypothetical protein [Providencia sp. PROV129]HEC8327997.1 hypothetical protein [Providencia rettgeri]
MSVKNLLLLTQRRLDKARQEQSKLAFAISELQQKSSSISERIKTLSVQVMLYEKAQELKPIEFWERQRLKAAILANIAQLEHQIDTISIQIEKYQQLVEQIRRQALLLHSKCEKFQKYLKQKRLERCLKLERQQENEIEELFIHVSH